MLEDEQREVFVKPPPELQLPRNKILKLNKTAYGLVDASRAFYLKQAKEMKEIGFNPTTMDPALFIHKSPGQEMCDAAAAVHVDDSLMAGKQEVINKARQDMSERLNYGSVEELPFRFLGSNYKRGPEGEIILDLQHCQREEGGSNIGTGPIYILLFPLRLRTTKQPF